MYLTYTNTTPDYPDAYIQKIEKEMKEAAKNLNFEEAMALRDVLFELKGSL